jgi:hypothetical protein
MGGEREEGAVISFQSRRYNGAGLVGIPTDFIHIAPSWHTGRHALCSRWFTIDVHCLWGKRTELKNMNTI